MADLVLVDTPAFLAVGDTSAIGRSVDGLLLLVDMTQVRRPVLEAAMERLQQLPATRLGVVIMRQKSGRGYHGGYYGYRYYYYGEGETRRRGRRKSSSA